MSGLRSFWSSADIVAVTILIASAGTTSDMEQIREVGRPPVGPKRTLRIPQVELDRIEGLAMPGETEAAVLRRVIHAGLNALEKT